MGTGICKPYTVNLQIKKNIYILFFKTGTNIVEESQKMTR